MLLEHIKTLCKEKGITLNQLSIAARLSNGTINGWDESVPRIDNLAAVARVLGVTVDELLREPEPTPEEKAKRDLAERLGCPVEALDRLDPKDLDTLLKAKPRPEAV